MLSSCSPLFGGKPIEERMVLRKERLQPVTRRKDHVFHLPPRHNNLTDKSKVSLLQDGCFPCSRLYRRKLQAMSGRQVRSKHHPLVMPIGMDEMVGDRGIEVEKRIDVIVVRGPCEVTMRSRSTARKVSRKYPPSK